MSTAKATNALCPVYIPSSEVARRLGVRRQTLAKWRMTGRGPEDWFYLNPTRCLYSVAEVEAYIRRLVARRPPLNLARRHPSRVRGIA